MQHYHDKQYLSLVENIFRHGIPKGDRTGTGTRSLPFQQMRFDLSDSSIPLLTTKKVFTRGIIHELLWFLAGDTNIKYLVDNNVGIWNEWPHAKYVKRTGNDISLDEFVEKIRNDDEFAQAWGGIGPGYGAQWRAVPTFETIDSDIARSIEKHIVLDDGDGEVLDPNAFGMMTGKIDQIGNIIHQLRTNPFDRRIILNAWNVAQIDEMVLPPCHAFVQFWSDGKELRCHLYQRSADVGLGVPFNIAQYSILTHMIAQVTGLVAREFVWTGGDIHIYNDHTEQLKEQLTRVLYPSPTLRLKPDVKEINDFTINDFEIVNYESHPPIKMPVSV